MPLPGSPLPRDEEDLKKTWNRQSDESCWFGVPTSKRASYFEGLVRLPPTLSEFVAFLVLPSRTDFCFLVPDSSGAAATPSPLMSSSVFHLLLPTSLLPTSPRRYFVSCAWLTEEKLTPLCSFPLPFRTASSTFHSVTSARNRRSPPSTLELRRVPSPRRALPVFTAVVQLRSSRR
jgi:hypothetical protein